MSSYTKLFSKIIDSSVWALGKDAKILWITMLAKKDRAQKVEASIPGLANAARLTIKETEVALKELEAPDKYSQTTAHNGRRVLRVEGGWFIVNGEKYRDMLSQDERREYKRLKQAEYRHRSKPLPGEREYVKALEGGASQETLDKIVDGSRRPKRHG